MAKKKTNKKSAEFPEFLYATHTWAYDEALDPPYVFASPDQIEGSDGEEVGIYTLLSIKKLRVGTNSVE